MFERLNPEKLADILQETVAVVGKTAAIDGKTIRMSDNERHNAYRVAGAWAAENRIALGRLSISNKPKIKRILASASAFAGKCSEPLCPMTRLRLFSLSFLSKVNAAAVTGDRRG